MPLMPGAIHRLDGADNGAMTRWDVLCFHTAVSSAPAPAAHFSVMWNGVIIQHRDTSRRSAANWNGNYRCIAIEFMDKGQGFPLWTGDNVPAMTTAQCEAGARIAVWVNQTHGVPLNFVLDSRPTTRGCATHRAGIDGNFAGYAFPGRVPGGEVWSQHFGKVCPTDVRIHQVRDRILPAARGGSPMTIERATQILETFNTGATEQAAHIGEWADRVLTATERAAAIMEELNAGATAGLPAGSSIRQWAAGLADDEQRIIAAVRDPANPANAGTVARVLAGVSTLLEADDDPAVVVGPAEARAVAEAILGAFPARLAPALASAFVAVIREGTDNYEEAPTS